MRDTIAGRFLSLFLLLLTFVQPLPAGADAAPSIEVYGTLPGIENAALSPSGGRIALIATVGEVRRLIVLGSDGQALVNAAVGDSKIRDIEWAGEEIVLVQASRTVSLGVRFNAAKTELFGMMVVPLPSRKHWTVFEGKGSITGGIRGFYGTYQRNGRWYGLFGGITMLRTNMSYLLSNTAPDLYEVDLQTGNVRLAGRRYEGRNGYFDWTPDAAGKVAARLEFYSSSGGWRIKNAEAKLIAAGRNGKGGIYLRSLGSSPDSLVFEQENEATGRHHFYEVPLSGGAIRELAPDVEVSRLLVDDRTRQLLGYVTDEDYPTEHFYAPHQQQVMVATRGLFPKLHVRLVDWNDAFDRLIVETDGPGDPGTWWYVNVHSGEVRGLGTSYALDPNDVAPVNVVQYRAADGLAINGVLTLPPTGATKVLPVVVLPHGGPAGRDYPQFDWWAQALASRGYAVFQPNFRGSTGYGGLFQQAGNGEWGRRMQTDISEGLAELARRGVIDPKRACIMGGSYGGYAALAGVTLQQGLYRCAVAVAGVADLERMYRTDIKESGGDRTVARILREQLGDPNDLDRISPIRFASRADAPILVIHGKDDSVVPQEQSKAMVRALRAANKPVEFVILKGEDHWLSRGATRLAMLKAAIDFVERHNPPDAAPKVVRPVQSGRPRMPLATPTHSLNPASALRLHTEKP